VKANKSLANVSNCHSAECRIVHFVTQVPGSRASNSESPATIMHWDCATAQPGDDDWQNADAIIWQHQRWKCSSPSRTEGRYDGEDGRLQ